MALNQNQKWFIFLSCTLHKLICTTKLWLCYAILIGRTVKLPHYATLCYPVLFLNCFSFNFPTPASSNCPLFVFRWHSKNTPIKANHACSLVLTRIRPTSVLDSVSASFNIVGQRVNVATPDFSFFFIQVILAFQESSYCPNFVDSFNPNAAGDIKSEHFELAGVGS
jgi:hypothetical protein